MAQKLGVGADTLLLIDKDIVNLDSEGDVKGVIPTRKLPNHRKISYESADSKIATVNKKGVMKGKKKGTCYVYVYAENGVSVKSYCKKMKKKIF